MKDFKTKIQDIHYLREKPDMILKSVFSLCEFFYGKIIRTKNRLYEKGILKEEFIENTEIICVGNLTTGGVGKTPIVAKLAEKISKTKKTAIISRGYKAKISTKNPVVIKDDKGLKFKDGTLCSDEPFQSAKNTPDNVIVIICKDRKKAIDYAIKNYECETIILDDGFSNRKVKKTKTFIVIDSKMKFGNNHLLPMGPLREPVEEIKRADEIILVDKDDKNIDDAVIWAKNSFNKKISIAKMAPKKIYNALTKAQIKESGKNAIAFCAIGQAEQFYNFAEKYYELKDKITFCDHYKYTKNDIKNLIKLAEKNKVNTFITTQKDETKIVSLIKNYKDYSFNVLELDCKIQEIN